MTRPSLLITLILPLLTACRDKKETNHNPELFHIPEVQIGKQIWASKNLDVSAFKNGDPIPHVSSNEEWAKAGKEGKPAWCYYENDASIGRTYGRMYNWHAVNDPRGLCPEGWHIPTNQEWILLEDHIGVPEAGLRLKSDEGWNNQGNGDNITGFGILPGGYRDRNGRFTGIGEFTYLTGATEDRLPDADENISFFIWGRGIHFENKTIMRCGLDKEFGLYVRCIKDGS